MSLGENFLPNFVAVLARPHTVQQSDHLAWPSPENQVGREANLEAHATTCYLGMYFSSD